jgi:hypothetical protein
MSVKMIELGMIYDTNGLKVDHDILVKTTIYSTYCTRQHIYTLEHNTNQKLVRKVKKRLFIPKIALRCHAPALQETQGQSLETVPPKGL